MADNKPQQQDFAAYPVNVRVKHEDGTFTALENVYGGEKDGTHHWYSVREINMKNSDRIVWDEMPANTRVHPYSRSAS